MTGERQFGTVTAYFFFWCAFREDRHEDPNPDMFPGGRQREAEAKARKAGWRLTEVFGWVCPECVGEHFLRAHSTEVR